MAVRILFVDAWKMITRLGNGSLSQDELQAGLFALDMQESYFQRPLAVALGDAQRDGDPIGLIFMELSGQELAKKVREVYRPLSEAICQASNTGRAVWLEATERFEVGQPYCDRFNVVMHNNGFNHFPFREVLLTETKSGPGWTVGLSMMHLLEKAFARSGNEGRLTLMTK